MLTARNKGNGVAATPFPVWAKRRAGGSQRGRWGPSSDVSPCAFAVRAGIRVSTEAPVGRALMHGRGAVRSCRRRRWPRCLPLARLKRRTRVRADVAGECRIITPVEPDARPRPRRGVGVLAGSPVDVPLGDVLVALLRRRAPAGGRVAAGVSDAAIPATVVVVVEMPLLAATDQLSAPATRDVAIPLRARTTAAS